MEIHLSNDDHWTKLDGTMVTGSAFFGDDHVPEEALAEKISKVSSSDELKRILSRANGFFSVIHDTGEEIYAAVDHVRSWPVYYAVSDDVYISDSAEWVHESGDCGGYDPVVGTEYLFTGFVTGRDTLSRDVKQVQAGELVTLDVDESGPSVHRERYFTQNPTEKSTSVEKNALDEVLVEAVERLIEYADGRTILLGLSGGYDSRLVALLLSRLGYDNTVAFTGNLSIQGTLASQGSGEVSVAKSIAEDLGFEHIELRSGRSDYGHIKDSAQMEMVNDIGYLSEYPSINKVVQRRKLKEAGIDPDKVVLVIGHHCLGGGSALPDWVREQETLSQNEFFDLMWNLHYQHWETLGESRWRRLFEKSRWRRLFEKRMLDGLPDDLYRTGTVEPTPDAVSGFEQWYWQERLAKYIIIRREYEYLGFDIWYPLLDRELYSFFECSSYRDRVGKHIWKEYIRELDERIRGEKSDLAAGSSDSSPSPKDLVWRQMVQVVHGLPGPATEFVQKMYYESKSNFIDVYELDPRYRIVTKEEFDSISFPVVEGELHRPLLLLYLYKNGFFDFPVETEFDRALSDSDRGLSTQLIYSIVIDHLKEISVEDLKHALDKVERSRHSD